MKAKQISMMMDEAMTSPLSSANAKSGMQVMYKPGTEFEGMVGFLVNVKGDKVDLKLGKSTRVDVPMSDLLAFEGTQVGSPKSEPEAKPADQTPSAPEVQPETTA